MGVNEVYTRFDDIVIKYGNLQKIETIGDAQKMRDFYQNRIAAERSNLDNLRIQSDAVGWNI